MSELHPGVLLVVRSSLFSLGAVVKRLLDRSLRSILSMTWYRDPVSRVWFFLLEVYERSLFVRMSTRTLLHPCDSVGECWNLLSVIDPTSGASTLPDLHRDSPSYPSSVLKA